MSIQIENGTIISDFKVKPDVSIAVDVLKAHYSKFPQRWDVAFKFLSETDLDTLPLGRIDLSDEVFVNIAEYITDNEEDRKYESHLEHIDIQYVIVGEEIIGVNRAIESLNISTPYDEEKDYMLYDNDGKGTLYPATQDNYFIFFPQDAHMPNVKAKENSLVRKLVVKIKYK